MYRIQITDPITGETSYLVDGTGTTVEAPVTRAGQITMTLTMRMHRVSHPLHDATLVQV